MQARDSEWPVVLVPGGDGAAVVGPAMYPLAERRERHVSSAGCWALAADRHRPRSAIAFTTTHNA